MLPLDSLSRVLKNKDVAGLRKLIGNSLSSGVQEGISTLISGSLERLSDEQIMGALSQRSQLIQQMKGEEAYKDLSPAELEENANQLILQQLMYDSALATASGVATHGVGTLMAGLNAWQDGKNQPVESFGEEEDGGYFTGDTLRETTESRNEQLASIIKEANVKAGVDKSSQVDILKLSWDELENEAYSNVQVRDWYVHQCNNIHSMIPEGLSAEEKARQAFELRNKYKYKARDIMADVETRKKLDKREGISMSFDEFVQRTMERKNMTESEALEYLYNSATRTNRGVNKMFGMEEK